MGGAIAEGFARFGAAAPEDITVTAPHESTLKRFKAKGIRTTSDNRAAAADADVIVIAVKPWIAEKVVREILPVTGGGRQTVVSVCAGISSAQLTEWFGSGGGEVPRLLLAIPNIAIATGCSMTFLVPVNADAGTTEAVKALFDKVGATLVTEERLLGAGTTLASCGIAYAMRYVRAASEGGVELGFKAKDASDIVLQTVKGAAALLQENGNHPEAEIDKVTTPGGLTVRGLNEMERAGFTSAVVRGMKAGHDDK